MKNKVIGILKNNSQKSVIGFAVEEDDFDMVAQKLVKLFAIPVVINQVCPKCKSDNTHSILNNEYSCFCCGHKFIGQTCL